LESFLLGFLIDLVLSNLIELIVQNANLNGLRILLIDQSSQLTLFGIVNEFDVSSVLGIDYALSFKVLGFSKRFLSRNSVKSIVKIVIGIQDLFGNVGFVSSDSIAINA
jgi:hypothetical protein